MVLPKDVLAKLGVREGQELAVLESPEGITLSPFDPEIAAQIAAGLRVMERYRNALRELAK